MTMKSRRSPWTLLVWPLSLLAILFAVWITGYLYWQIRISRALADLQRGPSRYFDTPDYRNENLLNIGSRGFPRFFEALQAAVARGDEDQAAVLYCGMGDLIEGAWGDPGQPRRYSPFLEKPSLATMRKDCREFIQSHSPDDYAPWWMWWSGSRKVF